MADTGAISPGTMADDGTIGTLTWATVDNAKASDNSYSKAGHFYSLQTPQDYAVYIVKADGTLGTENKKLAGSWPSVEAYVTYPASAYTTDLWSESWTAENINDINFGVVIAASNYMSNPITHYLKATNFGFTIPTGSTIDGILVQIEKKRGTCVLAGSLIRTPNGDVKIEDIRVGDNVLSFNAKMNKVDVDTVVETFAYGKTERLIYHFYVSGQRKPLILFIPKMATNQRETYALATPC
jgi:hypothetical protein